jgi:hypothetical protein
VLSVRSVVAATTIIDAYTKTAGIAAGRFVVTEGSLRDFPR